VNDGEIMKITRNKFFRWIVAVLFIVCVLFVRIPRTEKQAQEFLLQKQINYPLSEEITGYPRATKGVAYSREWANSRKLKISQKDGQFYWDSWKGQKLNVVRGLYYKSNFGLASVVFISEENDGMILIYNDPLYPTPLCTGLGQPDFGNRGYYYLEMRSPIDAKTEVMIGDPLPYHSNDFEKEICSGDYITMAPKIYFKPSLYQIIKNYF
jgi:hypothetical protein